MSTGEDDLERPDCPLCGPGVPRRLRYDFPPFAAVTCEGCGLLFLCPRLAEARVLELYQGAGYYDSQVAGQGYDEYLALRENWLRTFAARLQAIARHQPAGRALDVGCGPGFFLEAAEARGYEAWGIDPSGYAIEIARRRFGERVRTGVLEAAPFPPGHFDLVTAFDAFEHVYRPLRFLEAAHALLAPGGLVAITTPDPSSLLARLSGRRWVSFKIPEHVYYWSPRTIRLALEPRFELLEITSAGQYASGGFLLRRLLRLGPRTPAPLHPLVAALGRVRFYANNGSLTAIARRREVSQASRAGAA
ncbi:MAG: class I SAM-dependent methyltransferase [Betaproteobacteria bacterium]